MPYRFTRFWAQLLVALGMVIIALGLVGALGLFLAPAGVFKEFPEGKQEALFRTGGALLVGTAGVLLGGPSIVAGQVLLILLDQRKFLARLNGRSRRWERRLQESEGRR